MPKAPSQLTVLLAEDRAPMRKIIKTVLQNIGFEEVLEAVDGRDAFQLLVDRNKMKKAGVTGMVDLVIMDWMMPFMTGIEVLEKIRKNDFLAELPFIMLTAESDRESILKAIEGGVTDYIVKPFKANELEAKILAVLNRM